MLLMQVHTTEVKNHIFRKQRYTNGFPLPTEISSRGHGLENEY